MNSNPVVWFEIHVEDMNRCKLFYEAVLGVSIDKLDVPDGDPAESASDDSGLEMMAFPMQEKGAGAAGALVRMPGVPAGANSTVVYFGCDDCANEASRVATNGGILERDKFSIGPFGFIALATDPDGNRFGLHSQE